MRPITGNVPISKLLSDEFFQKHTSYGSFAEFLSAGGFYPKSKEDIENIPDKDIDAHVIKTTQFQSWHDLMEAALRYLIASSS